MFEKGGSRLGRRNGRAYVEGFQGPRGLARDGVMTVVKHWVGYGAQPEGFDAHNWYGRFARPGRSRQGSTRKGAHRALPPWLPMVPAFFRL